MKTRWLVVCGLAVVGLPLALSHAAPSRAVPSDAPAGSRTDPPPPPAQAEDPGRLRRVGDPQAPRTARAFPAERWAERLRDADLDAREEAFDELARRLPRDAAAREVVEAWARADDRPELAWTARLLLREAARAGRSPFQVLDPFRDPLAGRGLPFGAGDLRDLLEGHGLFGSGAPFDLDPRQRIEELLERMGVDPLDVQARPLAPGGTDAARSFRLEVTPDGVRCEVTEEVDGERSTKTWEAESLEALLEAHPELRDSIGSARSGVRVGPLPWSALRPGLERTPWIGTREVPTDVLGIECRRDDPRLDDVPGLEPGVGLYVERTVPGTIAHILGLKRGWVLVELNGRQLVDGDDVSAALRARRPDEPVTVTFVDGEGQRRTLTWKPAQPPRSLRPEADTGDDGDGDDGDGDDGDGDGR